MKVQEPSSVSSNIGKSTTNRNDQVPGSISSSRLAISLRAAPEQLRRRPARPGGEEDAVAGLRADGLDQAGPLGVGDVLGDRAAERAVLADR